MPLAGRSAETSQQGYRNTCMTAHVHVMPDEAQQMPLRLGLTDRIVYTYTDFKGWTQGQLHEHGLCQALRPLQPCLRL